VAGYAPGELMVNPFVDPDYALAYDRIPVSRKGFDFYLSDMFTMD
jgi:hypothetical protein